MDAAAFTFTPPEARPWTPLRTPRLLARLAKLALWSAGVFGLTWVMPPLLGDTQVVNSISIARSPAEVFDYATTPANWPSWHPASIEVSGTVDRSLNPGEQVTEAFRVAGREGRVVWTVRERAVDAKWVIDGRIEGSRGRGRITYLIAPNQTGTRFERELRYRMPNLFASIVDKLVTEDRIILESAEALQRLKTRLEAR
jgi:uncharacterized protein YndB with AHSA1/START domain